MKKNMGKNVKNTILLLIAMLFFLCQTAFALDLGTAKAQGLVGETVTGYLAPVKATPEVQKLVADINAKRKAMYEKIAKRNGTSLHAVELLAGKKAIAKTPPGQFVNLGKGWQRK